MSALEWAVTVLCWASVASAGFFTLFLYRQVERIYLGDGEGAQERGLEVGAPSPALSVVGERGEEVLRFDTGTHLVAFLSATCGACEILIDKLSDVQALSIGLLIIEPVGNPLRLAPSQLPIGARVVTVAHAPDVTRDWLIKRVPYVYGVRDGEIVLSETPAADAEWPDLVGRTVGTAKSLTT